MFLEGIVINIREINIVKLHTTQLFKLFLDTAAHFKGDGEDFLQFFF